MPEYRLSIPATVCATVLTDNEEELQGLLDTLAPRLDTEYHPLDLSAYHMKSAALYLTPADLAAAEIEDVTLDALTEERPHRRGERLP